MALSPRGFLCRVSLELDCMVAGQLSIRLLSAAVERLLAASQMTFNRPHYGADANSAGALCLTK